MNTVLNPLRTHAPPSDRHSTREFQNPHSACTADSQEGTKLYGYKKTRQDDNVTKGKRTKDPAAATRGERKIPGQQTHMTCYTSQLPRPKLRPQIGEGEELDPLPEGKNTVNKAQKHQDKRKGTPSEDPSSQPSRCGGAHGARRLLQTTTTTSHSAKYVLMHHEGGMTHIPKAQHATYYTPRNKNGKEHQQNLSPPQPTYIICRLRDCNPTQLHIHSPNKGKDLTAALHEKPDFHSPHTTQDQLDQSCT